MMKFSVKMTFFEIVMGGLRDGLGLFRRCLGVFGMVGDHLGEIWNHSEMSLK